MLQTIIPKRMGLQQALLSVLGGGMLFLSYPPFNFYALQWLAFVPFLLVLSQTKSLRQTYLQGTIFGTIAVFGGFNWIHIWAEKVIHLPAPLSYGLAFGYAFAIAQVFGLIALTYRWLKEKSGWSGFLLFPVTFVALFSCFPMLFYFKLGDAQSYFLPAIQAIDLTGVWGLDAILLLFNYTCYRLLQNPGQIIRSFPCQISLVLLIAWFSYGGIALKSWQTKIEQWNTVKIGLLQTNRPARLQTPQPEPGYSRTYPLEMALSFKLKKQAPDVIIWPEGNFFGYTFWNSVKTAFAEHVSRLGIPILFHDTTVNDSGEKRQYFNSAIFLQNNGKKGGIYHKIQRVPFGEYIPLTDDIPFLKAILGDYLSNLSAGQDHQYFQVGDMELVPKLCYESLFPEFVAEGIGQHGTGRVLVVQSQDGWFGQSAQPEQHLTASTLRAVENRVPLVHSINNGPSAITLPSGEYIFQAPFYQQGQWSVQMPFNKESGGSFYSQHPYLFITIIRALFVIVLGTQFLPQQIKNRFKSLFMICKEKKQSSAA